ncbi:MAG: 30S ribosomal protein S17 [Patescibacteria group bacterium]
MSGSIKRQLQGVVTGDKMHKTVVVRVQSVKKHPKYLKQYTVRNSFKAHDEKNEYHIGDAVVIEETRPLSRDKRWRVVKKIS